MTDTAPSRGLSELNNNNLLDMFTKPLALAASLAVAASAPPAPVEKQVEAPEEAASLSKASHRWVCEDCNVQERMALDAFQDRGITDRNALSALMGNIQQESRFTADICEGGARVPYHKCHTGGYGLIQWTTVGRYDGLGRHARSIGKDPSTTEAQLSYLFTEYQWKRLEPHLLRGGNSISGYMDHCYKWLGWGIHGNRTAYAHEYHARLS